MRGVDAWKLASPLPTAVAAASPASTEEQELAAIPGSGERAATQEMRCLAREFGRFVMEHEAQPSADLAACRAGEIADCRPKGAA